VEWARLVEAWGFDSIGITDSQSLHPDPYVALALVAQGTNRIHLRTEVTNPLTRHPAVTASAIASIHQLSGGRTSLGIASGDSAVDNIGLAPASLALRREFLLTMRALLRGEFCIYQGNRIHTKWIDADIPLVLAAEGPKSLRLAGELADVPLIHTGLTPEVLGTTVGHVREGENAAERQPGAVKIWAFAYGRVADTREEALEPIKGGLAASANHAFRFTLDGKPVPDQPQEPIHSLRRQYNNTEHGDRRTRTASLPDELGLTDFLAERFSVAGTPEECRQKIRMLESHGISGLSLAMRFDDWETDMRALRRIAEEVVAPLR
jgi:5,10-methylenetetrahydromethanopterin reductase